MTHTYGEHADPERNGSGLATDILLVAVLTLELVNFAVLAWLLRWTFKAGDRVIGGVLRSVGLNQGKNPSIRDQVRGLVQPRLTAPANNQPLEGELIPAGGLDLSNVNMDQLRGLAQQYLGQGGGDAQGIQLAQKFVQGTLNKNDLTSAIPFFMRMLQGGPSNNGQEQASGPFSRW